MGRKRENFSNLSYELEIWNWDLARPTVRGDIFSFYSEQDAAITIQSKKSTKYESRHIRQVFQA